MICVIALVVFGILGIFSATHRKLAAEAFNCVFRRITLRPCDTGFDQRMKSKIIGKLLTKTPKTATFVSKHFEVLSWVMVIVFLVSMFYSAYALYNLTVHGTCSPESPESCILTPEQIAAGCTCKTQHLSSCSLITGELCNESCDCLDEENCTIS